MIFAEALRAELAAQPELHVTETGQGEPLILLHGFAQTSYAWRYVAAELADRFRVLRVDSKGHGQSLSADRTGYSVYHQALAVAAMIERRKLSKVVIAGHSFGGGVALAATLLLQARLPGRQRALVIVDGMSYEQRPPLGIELLRWPLVSTLAIPLLPLEFVFRKGMAQAYHNPESLTRDAVHEYAQPLRTANGRRGVTRAARELRPSDKDEFVTRYPDIRVPTLILWGKFDRVIPPAFAARLHAEIPAAQLVWLECGHCPAEERPHEVGSAIAEFDKSL